MVRGHFSRYAHDKVMIVSGSSGPQRVLTGSTNFSVTGMYVNSNHVLVFNDEDIAGMYSQVFNEAWADEREGGRVPEIGVGRAGIHVRDARYADGGDQLRAAPEGVRRRR